MLCHALWQRTRIYLSSMKQMISLKSIELPFVDIYCS